MTTSAPAVAPTAAATPRRPAPRPRCTDPVILALVSLLEFEDRWEREEAARASAAATSPSSPSDSSAS